MMRRGFLMMLFVLAAIGCGGVTPDSFSDPVDVSGKVTAPGGKSVKDMVLNFQPTGSGLPVPAKLGDDGSFTAKVIPGPYTYFITAKPGRSTDETIKNENVWLKTIPEKYRTSDKDRIITVEAGKSLDLNLN